MPTFVDSDLKEGCKACTPKGGNACAGGHDGFLLHAKSVGNVIVANAGMPAHAHICRSSQNIGASVTFPSREAPWKAVQPVVGVFGPCSRLTVLCSRVEAFAKSW